MNNIFDEKLINELTQDVNHTTNTPEDSNLKQLTLDEVNELVNDELVQPTLATFEQQISALNKHLDSFYDYDLNKFSVETRMKILNAGIKAMRNEIEKTRGREERLENSIKLYNWAATKITDIMSLSKKTAGFITLIGLFSVYLSPQIKSQLSSIPYLREFFQITDLLSPFIMNANQIAAASASGYYVLITAGFTKEEIFNFFSKLNEIVKTKIRNNLIDPLLSFIGSTFFMRDYRNIKINFGDTPPPSLSQAIHDITKLQNSADENIENILNSMRSSQQQLAERVNSQSQEFGSSQQNKRSMSDSDSESEFSSQPSSKRLRVGELYDTNFPMQQTSQFPTQQFSTPQQMSQFPTQQFGTPPSSYSQLDRKMSPEEKEMEEKLGMPEENIHGGKKRRYKQRITHRRRKGRSQSCRKRKCSKCNCRKSRRYINRRRSRKYRR
jgi:hypothetical protein